MNSCSNCSSDNQDDSKFCRKCGQQLNEELSMKILFSATIANYFSIDSSLKKSLIPVLFKPGKIAKAFVNGKRTTFIHPAKFYLFSSFIFFIILGTFSNVNKSDSIQKKIITLLQILFKLKRMAFIMFWILQILIKKSWLIKRKSMIMQYR